MVAEDEPLATVGRLGHHSPVAMAAGALVEQACARAGLDDFGVPGWREGLEVLVASLEEEAQLSAMGSVLLPEWIIASLVTRLRLVGWAASHPEVVTAPVERPLFVVGMARSGTTMLANLLDQDTSRRSLLGWEAFDPVPPPEPEERRSGPRLDAARQLSAQLALLSPDLARIHHEEPDGPTECLGLLGQHFRGLYWQAAFAPTYASWALAAEHRSAYAHHRLALQVLQSRTPGRWSLKAVSHVLALEALVATYPDAALVVLHRDPVVILASFSSLMRSLGSTFSDADHRAPAATMWQDYLRAAVDRLEAFSQSRPHHRLVEVRYQDLVADPLRTLRHIYEGLGEALDPDAASRMSVWVGANPKGRYGCHRYSLADLCLDRGEIDERFADYRDRYDLEREPVSD